MHQSEPCLQSARCARRDFRDRTAKLHSARARARQGVRRSMAGDGSGRLPLPARGRGIGSAMPDLLLELFSEEIPARMQARAAEDLKKLVTDRLVAAGLSYEGAKAFATPRRLALAVQGVPARQPDQKEEKKGPRVGAPEGAIKGFLKAAGLASIDQAKVETDAKKGDFYMAVIEKKGRPALDALGRRQADLGAPAPFHRRDLRAGNGRARHRAVLARRDQSRR